MLLILSYFEMVKIGHFEYLSTFKLLHIAVCLFALVQVLPQMTNFFWLFIENPIIIKNRIQLCYCLLKAVFLNNQNSKVGI